MSPERQASEARSPRRSLPEGRLLLAWYGDDFTGSTDVMEVLAWSGLRAVLFIEPPGEDDLRRLGNVHAVGLAGVSRSLPVGAMESELRPTFETLRRLGPPLVHYKVCSTFDSSPRVGSIGKAIDIGRDIFSARFVPVLIGAPALGRYSVFGNLFARSGGESAIYRLDRHPTMSRHPVTPMDEGDLRVLLARQTSRPSALLDVIDLASRDPSERLERLISRGAEIVLFDVLHDEELPLIGGLIWERAGKGEPLFCAGSSGIEYALAAHWRESGLLGEPPPVPQVRAVESLAVVSGSCSPVTDRQIARALENGFAEVPLDVARLLDETEAGAEIERAAREGASAVGRKRSVIIHSCRGPDDPRLAAGTAERAGPRLGAALGKLLRELLARAKDVRRVAVTGGDTSGYVARELGIETLEALAPLAPGSPLCKASSSDPRVDGIEVTFKGGQVGRDDFLVRAVNGE